MVTWSSKKICCPKGRAGSSPAIGTIVDTNTLNNPGWIEGAIGQSYEKDGTWFGLAPNNLVGYMPKATSCN